MNNNVVKHTDSERIGPQLRAAVVSLVLLTLITGVFYPMLVTGISLALFPRKAGGSIIADAGGNPVGSELIGQAFDDRGYFWSRPSATSPAPYTAFNAEKLTGSSGSNLGPTNPALLDAVRSRIQALKAADPGNNQPVPVDLVTASGSGLDPHVSVAAAEYQVPRVARIRGMSEDSLRAVVAKHTEDRQLGVLGERRVNVLKLNLELGPPP
jgi:K+-transporting ATPase ATPase C chain